jgi:predicted transcriptional regulator
MASLAQEMLSKISERGTVHYTVLAYLMKISPDYAHLICRSLSKDEHIVIDDAGMCKISPKGENLLKDKTSSD